MVSVVIEILILVVLAGTFCWNRGLGAKVSGLLGSFDRPPVKELDVTGVNSTNVVLMDLKSGMVIGNLNGDERIYPAYHDENHDSNHSIGSIFQIWIMRSL